MCRPISQRNWARMKLAPFGSFGSKAGSMSFLGWLEAHRRREVFGPVDVSHDARIADGDAHQQRFVRRHDAPCALVAFQLEPLRVDAAADAHRMAAPRAEVRRREDGALLER